MVLYQLLKCLNWKNERIHFVMLEKIRKRRGSTIQEVAKVETCLGEGVITSSALVV